MIIYSVHVTIAPEVHDEWLAWMKSKHIPEVLACGLFDEFRFSKVLLPESGLTYIFEYTAKSMAEYERYQAEFAPALQADHSARYSGKCSAVRGIREVIPF